MARKKTTVIHVKIDISLYYKIKEIAEKQSRTSASVFRQAIKEFLDNRNHKK